MFASLGLHRDLERALVALGFEKPTPVQEKSIPPALAGRDVVACAQTGTGKTAAFLLPTLHRLLQHPARGTRVLVLTPTRELAAQVNDHLRELAGHTRLRGAAIYGGVAMGPQREAFRRGADVLVATPGRLLDHLQYDYASLGGIETLVLDEADRMLDMGFLPAIKRILALLPKKRQTLLFSATMPPPIVQIAREWMHDPVSIDIERKQATADGVRQALYTVAEDDKKALLLALLQSDASGTALVFTRTKHRADRLCRVLERSGVPAVALHGNRSQSQRTRALADFREGRVRVLVATDIAARGIDVEELGHVVNFDAPGQTEDYIHRVGRTGRAQAVGDAWTFVTPADEPLVRQVERAIGRKLPRIPLPPLPEVAETGAPATPGVRARVATRQRREHPAEAARGGHGTRAAQGAHGARDFGTGRDQDDHRDSRGRRPRATTLEPRTATSHPRAGSSHPRAAAAHPRGATAQPHAAGARPRFATSHPQATATHPRGATVRGRTAAHPGHGRGGHVGETTASRPRYAGAGAVLSAGARRHAADAHPQFASHGRRDYAG
ncbi:MAG: DEAD/DEAH box helicase, partial [Alphaproteobacteria bacterium]